ncbi:hypothetical protein [Xanthobacter agilis]|uniref:hypothetical protein n=1 Tax=Xanthobacter agilis TaxID=47492 RepID=UPI0037287197
MTDEERGALVRRLVAWMQQAAHIASPQRLALLHLAGSGRLLRVDGRLIAPVSIDELAQELNRCASATRAILSALQSDGYIARPAAGVIEITLAAEAAGWRGGDPSSPAPEHAAKNPAPRQKSSAYSSYIEIDSKKYNNINNLYLCADPSGFPAERFQEILEGIRDPEVRAALPHARDIGALAEALPTGDPSAWAPSAIAKSVAAIPSFGPSSEGAGVGAALIRSTCLRFGRMSVLLALQSLIAGKTPKALFIHMVRSSACDPDVSAWTVLRAVQRAAAGASREDAATAAHRPQPAPARAAAAKTRLQTAWDDLGGPPQLTGEFARLAARTLSPVPVAPPSLPPLRKS